MMIANRFQMSARIVVKRVIIMKAGIIVMRIGGILMRRSVIVVHVRLPSCSMNRS